VGLGVFQAPFVGYNGQDMPRAQAGTNRYPTFKTVSIAASKRVRPVPPAARRPSVSEIVEDVLGCKWTLHILQQIRAGIRRPGALARSAEGLTTKVLNERLAKLVRFGVLKKFAYPEVPPRVEYELTPLGARLNQVLDEIHRIQDELDREQFGKT
jgi:DNA-binding HxlR family transcriptional regulator